MAASYSAAFFFCRCPIDNWSADVQHKLSFYTSAEVMQLMRCCRSTLNNRIRYMPDFPKPAKFGRSLLWNAAAFDSWLIRRYGVQS